MFLSNLFETPEFAMTLVEFSLQFIADIGYLAQILSSFVANVPGYFGWLPSPVVTLLGVAFSIVVVYMILNRK